MYVDVLTEDDNGKQSVTLAFVESVSSDGDQYTIRYMVPSKKPGFFELEKETSIIDLECIDYFHSNVTTIGYTQNDRGLWVKTQDDADTESEYEPETSESSDSESLDETSEEENDEED